MSPKFINEIIQFIKSISPISIVTNISIAVAILALGLFLLSQKNRESKKKTVGGYVCVSLSLVAFVGAISNFFFSYIIFA
ncbi:MAG TPA: hypothetical protein IAC62_16430 [Candidatus Pelethocola excrementipullorum]|nr:hypothetical protein [Candidatus Pelethocola excrementipullorum]